MTTSDAIARARRLALAFCLAAAACAVAAVHAGDSAAAPDAGADRHARFVVLGGLDGDAVLDRATGLVWRRTAARPRSFDDAANACIASVAAGRHGFRLPTFGELTSLVGSGGTLPADHPFVGLPPDGAGWFWTASTHVRDGRTAHVRSLGRNGYAVETKDGAAYSLCVLERRHARAPADG